VLDVNTNQDGTAQDGRPATTQRAIQDNGQSLVCDDVAEQQGDENPMLALFQQPQNSGGAFLLAALARGCNDLQVDFVLAHECNGQAGKDSAQEDEGNGDTQIDP
jgi:hypothetical protein